VLSNSFLNSLISDANISTNDKVVAATHSADHTMVSSEKQEGVTDLDFYRNQAHLLHCHSRHVALVFLFVFLAFLCLATLF
jgi:hypothetical protein